MPPIARFPGTLDADFLDVSLRINEKGKYYYKLYDKRDNFPFYCDRYVKRESNMCRSVQKGSFIGQILRVRTCSFRNSDFKAYGKKVVRRYRECGMPIEDLRQLRWKIKKKYMFDIGPLLW